jgi:hypothetical protein
MSVMSLRRAAIAASRDRGEESFVEVCSQVGMVIADRLHPTPGGFRQVAENLAALVRAARRG